jgi:hypothetical protein
MISGIQCWRVLLLYALIAYLAIAERILTLPCVDSNSKTLHGTYAVVAFLRRCMLPSTFAVVSGRFNALLRIGRSPASARHFYVRVSPDTGTDV